MFMLVIMEGGYPTGGETVSKKNYRQRGTNTKRRISLTPEHNLE